jgi:hypothetical protein
MLDKIPHTTLVEQTNNYLIGSFNDSRKYFVNYLNHAKHIWKGNFRRSALDIKSRYMRVDKTTTPYSIIIPRDMDRLFNISIDDKAGILHSFVLDNTLNDVTVPTGKECMQCGETDDYGQCFNSIQVTTNTVVINSVSYTEKTWRKLAPNGDIMEIREVPTLKVGLDNSTEVVIETKSRYIANLEMKPCGCVKKNKSNKETIVLTCGLLVPDFEAQALRGALSHTGTNAGRMKVSNGRIWIDGYDIPEWVIVSYQTNGICGENGIIIPDYAADVIQFGIAWRSAALRVGVARNRFDVRDMRAQYDTAIQEMEEYLRPIRVEDFMALQMTIPLWGGTVDQSYMKNHPFIPVILQNNSISADDIDRIATEVGKHVNITQNFTTINNSTGQQILTYTQSGPSTTWSITHNLGYNPNVTTVDTHDNVIEGEVDYVTDGVSLTIKFNVPLAGKAFLT